MSMLSIKEVACLCSIWYFFILLFTLGLGYAFTEIRAIKFIINNLTIPSEINLDAIDQTEDDYSDAIGEDIVDFFDLGIA
ncbi:MAG: DUF898 family protein [Bacteroidia bacterium]|nr:DUF898 family protein [Bacteroidia bacterium]